MFDQICEQHASQICIRVLAIGQSNEEGSEEGIILGQGCKYGGVVGGEIDQDGESGGGYRLERGTLSQRDASREEMDGNTHGVVLDQELQVFDGDELGFFEYRRRGFRIWDEVLGS